MSRFINGWTKESTIQHIKDNFNGRSVGEDGICVYRTGDGKKCAVGLFIPDDVYSNDMEEINAKDMVTEFNLESYMPLDSVTLEKLQNVHDNNWDERKKQMIEGRDTSLDDMIKFIEKLD